MRHEYAAWCGLMLLASPLVWTHYFVLMYWPLALLTDRLAALVHDRLRRRLADLVGAALWIWLSADLFLALPAARAVGVNLLAVLAIWVAVVRLSLYNSASSGTGPG